MRHLTVVFVLLILVVSALACGSDVTPRIVTPVFNQPASTPAPTAELIGQDRSHPLPVGQAIQSGDITLQVGNVTRPADSVIAQGSPINPTPAPGNEYVMFDLTIACTAAADQKCDIVQGLETSLVGDKGVVYQPKPFLAGVSLLQTTEMFGGATVTGALVFEVGQGEGNLVFMYEPFMNLTPKVYLAVQ